MTTNNHTTTPADPKALRAEIERTRADLGETAAALAAKADIPARAKVSARNAAEKAKVSARDAAEKAKVSAHDTAAKAKAVAVSLKDRADAEVETTRHQLEDGDVTGVARRPIPMVALAAAVGAVALGVFAIVRRARR